MNIQSLPDDLLANMAVIAFLSSRVGDFERARTIHTGLAAVDPDNQHLLLASAVTDVMDNKPSDALVKLERVLESEPEYVEARCWHGYCQVLAGDEAPGRETLTVIRDDTQSRAQGIATELLAALDER